MNVPQTNLLEFIGAEQTNLLVTMVKCHPEIAKAFPMLDGAYQTPIKFIDVKIDDEHKKTILALYFFTHYHLYFSTVCLLRCHLSDSLGSTRKAIDATLTAYRLIEEPATLGQYHQQHRNYQNIKAYIARTRKHDSKRYSLAAQLIEFHELCSEFGSHADISSFVHRISIEPKKEVGKGLFKVKMFQAPDTDIELRAYLAQTLLAYTQMAKVFSAFVGGLAVGLDVTAWNVQLEKLEQAFASEGHKIDTQIKAALKTTTKAADSATPASEENL
jgi:hypothetical protein